ncbi:hypothetical protein EDD29_7195 [Actinocorallia herbida]|uniref:Nuclease-like protein n=1 Tax=Actinocorallia herbida TaxID=58109 RepID=A0A3N1D8T4_9ACTN|nr:hypothetical protein [Actinocorallia herbida]ROO89498.1 hypothetical protein EDD29_7195 [Actinocorallia herbida]
MFGNNIYQKENPALVGGSRQQVYEQLWEADTEKRKRTRRRGSVVALLVGYLFGVLVGGLAFYWAIGFAVAFLAYDGVRFLRTRAASRVWRYGEDGSMGTSRALRLLEIAGRGRFAVLHRRAIPGHGIVSHLVASPGRLWLVQNVVHAPDLDVTAVRGRLFYGKDSQSRLVEGWEAMARKVSEALSQEMDLPVKASVVVAVHGGRAGRSRMTAGGVVLMRSWRVPLWIRARAGDGAASPQEIALTAQRLFGPGKAL